MLIHRSPVHFRARSHTGVMDYDEACIMHLTPGGPQLPKGCGCIGFLSPMHKKILVGYSKREGDNPGNSGLLSQQYMVVIVKHTIKKKKKKRSKHT